MVNKPDPTITLEIKFIPDNKETLNDRMNMVKRIVKAGRRSKEDLLVELVCLSGRIDAEMLRCATVFLETQNDY